MNPLEFINQIKDMYNDQDPRSMAQGSRNTYSQGQRVTPSVDGSRPGYAGEEETATYKYEDSRLRYNKKTKKWEMIAGRDQELYIQEPGETKPQFKKRVKKVGIDRRTKAFDLQSKQRKTSQNYINNWTKDWLDNNLKNYGVRDFDKAMTAMGKDWQANIKNLDLPKGMTLSLSRGEFNLPNVTTTRVGKAGKKPFTYEGFNLHTMFENPKEPGKYMAQWKKMFMKNKIRTTPGLKKDILEYFKFINKDKRGKVWRQEGTVKAFKDIMNKDVIYLMSPDSGITGHGKESLFNSFDDAFNKEYNKYAKKINLGSNWKEAAAKIEKQLGYKPGHILKSMSKERKALQKLFNLKELPHELRYSLEHGQGIAAAAKTNNPVIMQRAMDDLIGTTVRQNKALGWGGFEATRNALMRDIMAGNNVTDNIKSLNELSRGAYKDFGLKGKMYSMKDGQLTSKPITTAFTQEERFKQYFKEIDKTKEGRAAIKKQHGSLKNLLTKLCPKGQASGGRIGYSTAGAVGSTLECGRRTATELLKKGTANTEQKQILKSILGMGANAMKGLGKSFSPAEMLKLRNLVGPGAWAAIGAFEAGAIGYDTINNNTPLNEALSNNWLTGWAMPWTKKEAQIKNLGEKNISGSPAMQKYMEEVKLMADYERQYGVLTGLKNRYGDQERAKVLYENQQGKLDNIVGKWHMLQGTSTATGGEMDFREAVSDMEEKRGAGEYVEGKGYEDVAWKPFGFGKLKAKETRVPTYDLPPSIIGKKDFKDNVAYYQGKTPFKGDTLTVARPKRIHTIKNFTQPNYRTATTTPLNANQLQAEAASLRDIGILEPRGEMPQWYIDQLQQQEKWRQLFEQSPTGLFGSKFASGGRAGYMGGGIAAIRKPHAIPPKRQGLRSIMINVNDD